MNQKILLSNDFFYTACSQGKLIIRPSPLKITIECLAFLERIQGDRCEPIQPASRPFRYFMVLTDASTCWSHVCLLSTNNVAFARFLSQVIQLRALFPNHAIKTIRLDNAGEFTLQAFNDYCMSIEITMEYLVSYVHT